MFQVARHAAKSFMNTNRRAIVCRIDLSRGRRCAALVAKRLTLVRANSHRPGAFQALRLRQFTHLYMCEFPPVK
jgi:hypothetical protein